MKNHRDKPEHASSDAPSAAGRWTVYAMLVAVMALWGGTWPAGRVVARSIRPYNAALLRFVLASAALVLICLRTYGRAALRVRPGLVPKLLLLGATGIFGYSLLFFSGLIDLVPLFGLLLGCVFLDEPLHLSLIGGGLMIIAGVVVTVRTNR